MMAMACETLASVWWSTRSSPYRALAEVGMTIATEAIISKEQQALFTMRLKLCVRYRVPPHRKQNPARPQQPLTHKLH